MLDVDHSLLVALRELIRSIVWEELESIKSTEKPAAPRVIDEKEFHRLYGLAASTQREFRKGNKLRFVRVGRKVFYLPEHIEEFLRQHERGGKPRR